ncbi:ABC transporter ATP-binding protein [Paenibacillus nasutitermitis]|uniref:Putative hemin import ATP-binding protein HrtA n=1 Tax=Paenibacillus nasutitermitis TaxID=1652958 RepID=A0A916YPN7_9BACL|nr:ABC transporter ATP-binding protein [Paenibacillus nasutitermitis]GGD53431.1 ABC transporter ATP-binding protein [Paenibacillus nasutitermitis]
MSAKLIMNEVSRTFHDGDSELTVLNKLSLKVDEGELVAVMGPSGSGKSTFLSIAGALLSPTAGEVIIDGVPLFGMSELELAELRLSKIGFIFQSANLIPYLKVKEQLQLVAKLGHRSPAASSKRSLELLDRMGLRHRLSYYPDKLSGGEKQRVAIARAWMNKPALLFADEPTASLDASRGQDVVKMIADEVKAEGRAAVMVTHDERVLHLCDRVLYLRDGALKETQE